MSDHSWDDPDDEHPDGDHNVLDYLPEAVTDDHDHDGGSDLDAVGGALDDGQHDEESSGTEYFVTPEVNQTPGAESYSEALDAHDAASATAEEATGPVLFTVTNPTGTISAKATIAGAIRHITLTPQATALSEADLARGIIATAKLANMKGRAVQRALIEGVLLSEGLDPETVETIIETNASDLPTPRQADDAVAEAEAAYLRGEH
jgi:hypothetical protein